MSVSPVIFVVGPSGVGKDDACGWIKTRYNFEHVDVDQPGHFHAQGLLAEWNSLKKLDPGPLGSAVRQRVFEANAIGAVISLPSDRVIMPEMAKAAEIVGIYTLVLWGTEETCKVARKGRDGEVKDTYDRKNRKAFATYGAPEFAENRVEVFGPDGTHLQREQVRTRIRKHLAGCHESAQFESWARVDF